MDIPNFTDLFDQATARIDKLIWIPAALGGGAISEDLREMIDDLYDNNEQIISRLPRMKEILCGEDRPDGEEVLEALAYVDGFFAQMARPIPTSFWGKGAHSFSWGYYQTEWVYAESLDELAALTRTFSEQVVEHARAEAAA